MFGQRIWELHHRRFIGTFKTSTTDRFFHGYNYHNPTSHYDCAILCGDVAGYSAVTECFGYGVKPKFFITREIDFLEIILELKDRFNR
jgi:hypothetical protein